MGADERTSSTTPSTSGSRKFVSPSPEGVDHSDGSVIAVTATASSTSAANGWAWSQAIGPTERVHRRHGTDGASGAVVLLEDDRAVRRR